MKRSLFLALAAIAAFSSISNARPDRTEGASGPDVDQGPRSAPPTVVQNEPDHGQGGNGSWSTGGDRPSRDVDHSSSDDVDYGPPLNNAPDDGSPDYFMGVACSPADLASNVAVTDRTLKQVAASKDFAAAPVFKTQVAKISAMANASAKAAAYFKLAGIDSRNSKAVADFIGAREAKGTWIVELERNASLSEKQAETVASSLQSSLRGGLQ